MFSTVSRPITMVTHGSHHGNDQPSLHRSKSVICLSRYPADIHAFLSFRWDSCDYCWLIICEIILLERGYGLRRLLISPLKSFHPSITWAEGGAAVHSCDRLLSSGLVMRRQDKRWSDRQILRLFQTVGYNVSSRRLRGERGEVTFLPSWQETLSPERGTDVSPCGVISVSSDMDWPSSCAKAMWRTSQWGS